MARNVRLIRPHIESCNGVREVADGRWDSAWWMPGRVVRADRHGAFRKHAHNRWHVLQCNTTDCDAEAIVSESTITVAVDAILAGEGNPLCKETR